MLVTLTSQKAQVSLVLPLFQCDKRKASMTGKEFPCCKKQKAWKIYDMCIHLKD